MDELVPVSLVFADVMTEASGYRLFVAFDLSVRLRMICSCRLSSDTEDVAHSLLDFDHKLGTVI